MSLSPLFTSRQHHWFIQMLTELMIQPDSGHGLPVAFFTCNRNVYFGYFNGNWGRYVLERRPDLRMLLGMFVRGEIKVETETGEATAKLIDGRGIRVWYKGSLSDSHDAELIYEGYAAMHEELRLDIRTDCIMDTETWEPCAITRSVFPTPSVQELEQLICCPSCSKAHAAIAIASHRLYLKHRLLFSYAVEETCRYLYECAWFGTEHTHMTVSFTVQFSEPVAYRISNWRFRQTIEVFKSCLPPNEQEGEHKLTDNIDLYSCYEFTISRLFQSVIATGSKWSL